MNIDYRALMEVLGPIIAVLFLTVTVMFAAIPFALERHPFDDPPAKVELPRARHLT
jgi:hypothetical protein